MTTPALIREACERLLAGGLVAFPTETVYGLGALARDAGAVARVFELKGRPATNPLIVHVDGPAMARAVTKVWTSQAQTLADAFWPGPLTIVLPKADWVPANITAGGSTVGVRCPDHPLTIALLGALGAPLVGPSANPSGGLSPTSAEHVRASWTPSQVLVLDGGPCRSGIESTVVLLDPGETLAPLILRPGVIGAEDLQAALGIPVRLDTSDQPNPAPSPGILGPHYQPRTELVLLEETEVTLAGDAVITLPSDGAKAAQMLYASLRNADDRNAPRIAVILPPTRPGPIWIAIMDRLARASARG